MPHERIKSKYTARVINQENEQDCLPLGKDKSLPRYVLYHQHRDLHASINLETLQLNQVLHGSRRAVFQLR